MIYCVPVLKELLDKPELKDEAQFALDTAGIRNEPNIAVPMFSLVVPIYNEEYLVDELVLRSVTAIEGFTA